MCVDGYACYLSTLSMVVVLVVIIGLDWKYYSIVIVTLYLHIILLLGLRSGMPVINEY